MDESLPLRISSLERDNEDVEMASLSPCKRLELMWQLTVDAWSFKENFDAESRLPRHIVSVRRRGG